MTAGRPLAALSWPSAPRGRALVVLVLLVGQVGLLVWFGTLAPDPALGRSPGTTALAGDYDSYVGRHVELGGRVVATDPVTVLARHPDGFLRLTVRDVDHPVAVGDTLRAYGVVEPDRTVRALRSFAVPRTGTWYTLGISFLAGLWTLWRVVRHWRYAPGEAGLEPRPAALPGGGDDA